ncbi:MAG: hypothetical protein R3B91_22345 [Planctomycetaceae bacterium]
MELDERIDQIKAEFDAETIEIEPYEIKPANPTSTSRTSPCYGCPTGFDIDEPAWEQVGEQGT